MKAHYTLWGRRIAEGDHLSHEEIAALRATEEHCQPGPMRRLLRDIIDAAPVSIAAEEEPVCETTRRAREAFIATGEMPGSEDHIRAGGADHLIGVRAAIQAIRDREQPLPATGQPVVRRFAPPAEHQPRWWDGIALWLARSQHRWAKLLTRYGGARRRMLSLAQTIVIQKASYELAIRDIQKRAADMEKKNEQRVEHLTLEHRIELRQAEQRLQIVERDFRSVNAELQSRHARLPLNHHLDSILSGMSQNERQAAKELLRRATLNTGFDKTGRKVLSVVLREPAPWVRGPKGYP